MLRSLARSALSSSQRVNSSVALSSCTKPRVCVSSAGLCRSFTSAANDKRRGDNRSKSPGAKSTPTAAPPPPPPPPPQRGPGSGLESGSGSRSGAAGSGPTTPSSPPTSPPPPAQPVNVGDLPKIMGKHARYAYALYEACSKNNNLQALENDVKILINVANIKSGFFKTLYRATWPVETNVNFVTKRFAPRLGLSKETTTVLGQLTRTKDLELVPRLAASVLEIIRHVRGEMVALVVSAEPLDEAQQTKTQSVLNAIAQLRGKKSVSVTYKVDPTILGGLRFFLNEKEFVDFSVSQEVDAFETRVANQSVSL